MSKGMFNQIPVNIAISFDIIFGRSDQIIRPCGTYATNEDASWIWAEILLAIDAAGFDENCLVRGAFSAEKLATPSFSHKLNAASSVARSSRAACPTDGAPQSCKLAELMKSARMFAEFPQQRHERHVAVGS
jgi:hypothetical protein